LKLAVVLVLSVMSAAMRGAAAIPDNDNFATRTVLSGASVSTTGNNIDATTEPGEPDPAFEAAKSVWWTWTAPADGGLTLTTTGSSFDTFVTLFTGNVLSNLSLVAFNDEDPLGTTNVSRITVNVTAGTAYQISVDGSLGATGSIVLQLTLGPAASPPPNDNFANRITLTGTHFSNVTADNTGATRQPGEPFHADALGGKSVWWTWTAPVDGGVTLTTVGSVIDTVVGVYTGNSLASLVFVAGNDEDPLSSTGLESRATFNATSGTTYQIAVDGYDGDEGFIRLRLDVDTSFPVPPNDNFANRIALTGSSITTTGSNVGATFEIDEPMHLVTFGGKSVWWTWTAPASGGVTLDTGGSVVDTILCVYKGNSLANLTFVAGNDEDFMTTVEGDSKCRFNVTAGMTYQIAVDGYDGDIGNITLHLVLGAATAVPANDNFANRLVLTGSNPSSSRSNLGATFETGEPLHDDTYGGKSIWWQWTAPGAGFVTIDTIGSLCDTLLAVYTGSTLSSLVDVASDDESGGNYTSRVKFTTKSNVTYQIAVDGYDDDAGDIALHILFTQASYTLSVATNPIIAGTVSVNPLPDQGGKYAPGSVVVFTATPSGNASFTGWTGDVSSTSNPLALTMNSNKTIVAGFYVPPTTKVWTGASALSGNWTDDDNWDAGAPIVGDKLVFPAGASRLASNTNNFPANTIFDSITFGDAGYILRGNLIGLNNGIVSTNTGGTNTLSLNILLNSHQSFRCSDAGAGLEITGNMSLGNRTLTVEATGDVILSGVVSGTGGMVKTNPGTLSLMGGNGNTYTGSTVVNEGILELGKTGTAVLGPLIVGDGVGGANADVVRFTRNSQLAGTTAVTINSSGLLDLDGFTGVVGLLTFSGGNASTGTGSLGLNSNLTVNAASAQATITGSLLLQGATRTFNVANGSAPIDLLVSAVVANGSGTGAILKTGAGRLQFAAANTYTGTTTIDDGVLAIVSASGLGTTNQGTVVNSGAMLSINGVSGSGESLTLAGGTLASDTGSNYWSGSIQLSSDSSITAATSSILNLSGVISGTGGLTKGGDGTLIFSGALNNTYSGITTINQGTLLLGKGTGPAVPAALVIGDGIGGVNADLVRFSGNSQIASSSAVTINSSGRLDLDGFTGVVGSLSMTSGNVATGTGSLGLNGPLTVNAASAQATISGNLSLQGATRTFNVANGSAPIDLLVSAVIANGAGTGGILKAGAGALHLTAANSYSGATTVNEGTLAIFDMSGLGTTNQGTAVNTGARLSVNGVSGSGESLSLAGGTLATDSGSNYWTGSIQLNDNSNITTATNTVFNLAGVLSGTGGVTKTGDGTLIFSGALNNTYAGVTTVNQGTLLLSKTTSNAVPGALIIGDGTGGSDADVVRLGALQQISINSDVTVNSSGLLDLNGSSDSIALLSGNGHIETGGAAAILAVGHDNSSTTFGGIISGAGGLAKNGAGMLTLNGDNTHSGPTIINNGSLIVNGSQPGSAVTVNQLGLLGGTGRVGDLSGPGTISPGASPGVLQASNVTFTSNTTFRVELNGPAPGSGHDQLKVGGDVNLSGTLNASLGFAPGPSDTFTIIDNNANHSVTGTFDGLPEGSYFVIGGAHFQISYVAGPGANDVTLTHVEPPQVTCLPDVTTNAAPGLCSQTIAFIATINTGIPMPTVSYKLAGLPIVSPYGFPVGTNTIVVTATNGVPPDATCSFTVIVRDNEAPTVTCPSNVTVTAAGACPVTVNYEATAADNCSVASLSVNPPSGSTFPVGDTSVKLVATDASGNTNTCSFLVTVLAGPAPELTLLRGNGQNVVVSWPASNACYELQYVSSFIQPPGSNAWLTYSGPLTTNGGFLRVTNSAASGNQYYRLRY
jgi:autotransporter-associated beta strand protein